MKLDIFLQITLVIVTYIVMLFILRKLNIWKKKQCDNCTNCCPTCKEPLERIKREKSDRFINYITFQIFDFKKYKCVHCAWIGRRWDRSFSGEF